jgi:hypothetical protein
MNNLVKGTPQRVQDGAVLLAISSWHLYPDMELFGNSPVRVKQKDSIFESAAILTLGLKQIRENCKSVYWSLPLSCLQYYGDHVIASRKFDKSNTRAFCEQFAYIVLGCLFVSWGEFATSNDMGLKWVGVLCSIFVPSNSLRISLKNVLRFQIQYCMTS